MDSMMRLSGQLLGLWLAIIGIAIALGVLFAIGSYVGRMKRHRGATGQETTN